MMTIKEFKEYLNRFDENEGFSVVVVNKAKRIVHKHKETHLVADMPAIIIETEETEPFEGEGLE